MTSGEGSTPQDYVQLRPSEFSVLEELVLRQTTEDGLVVLLEARTADLGSHLSIVFSGVRGLSIDWPEWSVVSLDLVGITDVTGEQLEDLNFRVAEASGLFVFSCRQFQAMRR